MNSLFFCHILNTYINIVKLSFPVYIYSIYNSKYKRGNFLLRLKVVCNTIVIMIMYTK